MFLKIVALKNFAIFTGKHLCWSLFIKNRLQQRCFLVNIGKFLRAPILKNICKRLLLNRTVSLKMFTKLTRKRQWWRMFLLKLVVCLWLLLLCFLCAANFLVFIRLKYWELIVIITLFALLFNIKNNMLSLLSWHSWKENLCNYKVTGREQL